MSPELLVAKDVGFQVGKSRILEGVGFALPRSRALAVVGHNGAGKTTLFHLLLGLKFRTGGTLTLNGTDVEDARARRDLGFVPERPYLNLDLSFRRTLVYLGKLSGLPAAGLQTRIEELAAEFELTRAIDQPLKTYSKGMLQRTLIAQAELHRPNFLILDEPMSGLDPEARKFLRNRLQRWKQEGKTLLFSSHAVEDVRDLADDVLALEAGQTHVLRAGIGLGARMITIIGQTLRDLYRERLLYNVFFVSLFLIFVGYLASLLAFGHQDRVLIHFGTTIISLTAITLGLTTGSRLIRLESEQRTVYLPLARPLTRTRYFFGRAGGVAAFILLNLVLLTLLLFGVIRYLNGDFRLVFSQWFVLTWLESLLALGLSLALSFGMRPGLNLMTSITFLFLAHNHEQMAFLQEKAPSPALSAFTMLTPDASVFFLDTRIYYDLPLTGAAFATRVGYGALWAAALLVIANALFRRRNL